VLCLEAILSARRKLKIVIISEVFHKYLFRSFMQFTLAVLLILLLASNVYWPLF